MENHSEITKKVLYRTSLSDKIAELNLELFAIKRRRIEIWPQLRADSTSDKQADMKFEASADGIREMEIKFLVDALKNKKSDLKMEILALQDEARGIY